MKKEKIALCFNCNKETYNETIDWSGFCSDKCKKSFINRIIYEKNLIKNLTKEDYQFVSNYVKNKHYPVGKGFEISFIKLIAYYKEYLNNQDRVFLKMMVTKL
jgi:endogenous inhibitor of DNA gyrase (YacG/DUF329 family)